MRCVTARDFNVGKALAWRSSIDDDPPYQRPGDVWSLGRRQRFIDSLINGYDVPKIYLHDLRGIEPSRVYAVVDGKQRLTAIWDFLRDGFGLADDFRLETPLPEADDAAPAPGVHFSDLGGSWRSALLRTELSVVLIQGATEDDIEELFSRLNSGIPLEPGERWQSIGGDTMAIVRDITRQPAFIDLVRFPDVRAAHADLAVRLVARAAAERDGILDQFAPDPDSIEAFVRRGRRLEPRAWHDLLERSEGLVGRLSALLGEAPRGLDDPARALGLIQDALEAAERRADLHVVATGPA